MLGCTFGRLFQVTVAGGSYQNGLTTHMQGVPPGYLFTEEEIYSELLQRKPGQGQLSSPRREPDIPIIYSGVNAADTMEGYKTADCTNGTPLVILIPNLDRHFEHIEQYRTTNRTPRPGHASYASFQKYGTYDDSIGAGFFSGRYTSTLVAAGAVAKRILKDHGIEITSYVTEAAGIKMPAMDIETIKSKVAMFKAFRKEVDPVHTLVFKEGRFKPGMRFIEKAAVLGEIEKMVPDIKRDALTEAQMAELKDKGIHCEMNCPDLDTAQAMYEEILRVRDSGDSSGGIVEIVVTGVPTGLGEPIFHKLDAEIGAMMGIGTVKAVEVGIGLGAATATGSVCNDQLSMDGDKVVFSGNNAGGITGGLTTGQNIVARLAVKPTPTIAKPQVTIDKVSLTDAKLAAVTRRDPTIVSRVWPVAEAQMAMIMLDHLMMRRALVGMDRPYEG